MGRKLSLDVKLGRKKFIGPNREADFQVVSNKEFSHPTTAMRDGQDARRPVQEQQWRAFRGPAGSAAHGAGAPASLGV